MILASYLLSRRSKEYHLESASVDFLDCGRNLLKSGRPKSEMREEARNQEEGFELFGKRPQLLGKSDKSPNSATVGCWVFLFIFYCYKMYNKKISF